MKIDRAAFIFLALVFYATFCWSQQITGNLEGRVLNQEHKPLALVNIAINSPSLLGTRGSASDDNGIFRFPALPVGLYQVEISHIGFQGITYEDLVISLGQTTVLEIQLQPRTLEMDEITIYAAKPLIDPTTTTTGNNLKAEYYELLPVERNYLSIVSLAPQANLSYYGDQVNISGSTGPENIYFIDGINVTDPYQAATGTKLPYNFVKEIEVKTGGYEAEYGRAMGGIVNVITYSGSNELHGKAFGFFNNNRLTGKQLIIVGQMDKGDFVQYDIGFSLGGPIKKDKLWFFAAYNPNFENEEVNIPGFGIQKDKKTTHIFAGKLTWQATSQTNFAFNVFGDISKRDMLESFSAGTLPPPTNLENIDPILGISEEGGVNLSLSGRHLFGNSLLLKGSVSRIGRRENQGPATEFGATAPFLVDYTSGVTYSGGYGITQDLLSRRTAVSLNATRFLSNHTIKVGVDFEDNFLQRDALATPPGIGERQDTSSYSVVYFGVDYEVRNRIFTVYLQDSWQVNDWFQINGGLRLDAQYLIGADGSVAQPITDQYQPRLGFVFQPGEAGSQKIYGGYGRFYEQIPTAFAGHFGGITNGIIFYSHDPFVDPSNPDLEFDVSTAPLGEVKGLEGEHFDEFSLGYERIVANRFKFGVRGIFRKLRQVIENGYNTQTGLFIFGNPGKGELSYMPDMDRDYRALEFTFEGFNGKRFNFLTSYVLSRNYGNYEGFFDVSQGTGFTRPNSLTYDFVDQFTFLTGLLPNDRTHVFKFSGSYRLDFGLGVGTSFLWQSGTPLSELGKSIGFGPRTKFLQKRGSLGRSNSIWDLNLRVSYDFENLMKSNVKPKLILDLLHVGSQRTPVFIDQTHYFGIDANGNQITPNANYLEPLAWQPPFTVRVGLEVGF